MISAPGFTSPVMIKCFLALIFCPERTRPLSISTSLRWWFQPRDRSRWRIRSVGTDRFLGGSHNAAQLKMALKVNLDPTEKVLVPPGISHIQGDLGINRQVFKIFY